MFCRFKRTFPRRPLCSFSSLHVGSHDVTLSLEKMGVLLSKRGSLSGSEIVDRLAEMHEIGCSVPLTYYRRAVDICAFRCDIDTIQVILKLAERNLKHRTCYPTQTLFEMHPFEELVSFTLEKFAKYGYSVEALHLWKLFSSIGSSKKYLSSLLERSCSSKYTNPKNLESMEHIHMLMKSNLWNQHDQYYCTLLRNIRDYAQSRKTGLIQSENERYEHINEPLLALANSLYAEALNSCPPSSDTSTLVHLHTQILLALSSCVNPPLPSLYQQSTEQFATLCSVPPPPLPLSTQTPPDIDHGDCTPTRQPTHQQTPTFYSPLEATLIECFQDGLRDLQSSLSLPPPLSFTSLLFGSSPKKQSSSSSSSQPYKPLNETHRHLITTHSPPNGGADAGANYMNNLDTRIHRETMSRLLDRCTQGEGAGSVTILQHLMTYLSRYMHTHNKTSEALFPSTSSPIAVPLPRLDDAVDLSLHPPFIPHSIFSKANRQFTPYGASVSLIPVHFTYTSEPFFIRLLLNQAVYNARFINPRVRKSQEAEAFKDSRTDKNPTPVFLSLSEAKVAYDQISNHAKLLLGLADIYGVEMDACFFANWIHTLPLVSTEVPASHTIHSRSSNSPSPQLNGYHESYSHTLGIAEMYNRYVGSSAIPIDPNERKRGVDLINEAILIHLCNYGTEDAYLYAVRLAPDLASIHTNTDASDSTERLSNNAFNILLTSGLQFRFASLAGARQELVDIVLAQASDAVSLPLTPNERRYQQYLQSPEIDSISQEVLREIVESCPSSSDMAPSPTFDPNLALALLRNQTLLHNGAECLRLMKALHHYGVVLKSYYYVGIISAINWYDRYLSDPLSVFISNNADLMSRMLYQEMIKDAIPFTDKTVIQLLRLYQFPCRWHLDPRQDSDTEPRKGPLGTKELVIQAKDMMIEICREKEIRVTNEMVILLVRMCCIARLDNYALNLIDMFIEENLNESSLSAVHPHPELFGPIFQLHASSSLPIFRQLDSISALFEEMHQSRTLPDGDMLDELVHLLLDASAADSRSDSSVSGHIVHGLDLISSYLIDHHIAPSTEMLQELLLSELQSKRRISSNKVASVVLMTRALGDIAVNNTTRRDSFERRLNKRRKTGSNRMESRWSRVEGADSSRAMNLGEVFAHAGVEYDVGQESEVRLTRG